MSQTMDLDSDQFMTLLTDALRAGPGSPEWHQAVGVLRTSGAKNVDEYQLLVQAREDLESGREYRSVRAGAGFTRKVMDGVGEEASASAKGLPSANLIALLAAGVILAVVVVIAIALFRNEPPVDRGSVERLQATYFINPVAQLNLENGIAGIGPEWRIVGEVRLLMKNSELGPAATQPTKDDKREYKSGTIVLSESIASDQPRAIDVTFSVNRPSDAVVPQVFIAEGPLTEGKANGGRELVWLLKNGIAQVARADQTVPAQGDKIDLRRPATVNVKIRFNKDAVIVDSGDKRIYEGRHMLSETAPRYVGVRFLRKVGDNSDGVWLTSMNVLKP